MIILRGKTAHFSVDYDDTVPNGPALADDVLARCEADLTTLGDIWVGTPPEAAYQVHLVPGGGGGSHIGANITCKVNSNTDASGISALVVAEVDEVFMSDQEAALGKGFDPGHSHGEGLSRVLAAELYPAIAGRFATCRDWLNSARPDWVTNTDLTDQNGISYGCASLFLNYLHYQLGFSWAQIVAKADKTLALVAQNLGVQGAYGDFTAVLSRHYPPGTPVQAAQLPHDPEGLNFYIDNLFPLSCLYMRHNLADNGTSHAGPLANSPDIIVKNSAITNPQATYSTPASIASDTESDGNVIDTQDNHIYLRVWNLGAGASDVTAAVYWSTPATLITPAMWNPIGQATLADVPAGRAVRVSDPGITWAQAAIPGAGHYCFIATVGNTGDPAPTPATFATFAGYLAYIEANNNITWRNFNVVAHGYAQGGRFRELIALPFVVAGAWDEARRFELEVVAELPRRSHLALDVPAWLGSELEPGPTEYDEDEDADADPDDRQRLRIPLKPDEPAPLGAVELKAGAVAASHLLVRLPDSERAKSHVVAVRQLFEGREVGRVTWRLEPDEDEVKPKGSRGDHKSLKRAKISDGEPADRRN